MPHSIIFAVSLLVLGNPSIAAPVAETLSSRNILSCPSGYKAYERTVDANFDDLQGLPVATVTNAIPEGYFGYLWQAFGLGTAPLDDGQPYVVPHSPPHSAVTGPVTQTVKGTAMISSNRANSNVTSFDPKSLYFGCFLNTLNGVAFPPQSCLMTFTGYRGSDNSVSNSVEVCAATFQYLPSTSVAAQQSTFAALPASCSALQFAIITIVPFGQLAVAGATLELSIDDFVSTQRGCITS